MIGERGKIALRSTRLRRRPHARNAWTRSLLPRLEPLECRRMLSVQPFSEPLDRLEPFGSLVYRGQMSETISAAETDTFTIELQAGQRLTAVVAPDNNLQPSLEIRDPQSGLIDSTMATGTGELAVLQSQPIAETGTYEIIVAGANSTTGDFDLQLTLNASVEAVDTSSGTALAIDNSFVELNGFGLSVEQGRYAVVGHSPGSGVDVDEYTLDLTGKTAQTLNIVMAGVNADFSGATLELLDTDGSTVLETAVSNPLGTTAMNLDQVILGFVVPDDGVYTLRVSADVNGVYTLLVAEEVTFDVEGNSSYDDVLQALQPGGIATGFVGGRLFGLDIGRGGSWNITQQPAWRSIGYRCRSRVACRRSAGWRSTDNRSISPTVTACSM